MTEWQWLNGPWKDEKNPIIVETWVYGIPRSMCTTAGLSRKKLQKILSDELKKFIPKGLPSTQRKLTLRFLSKDKAVESNTTLWTAGAQQPDATRLILLDKVKVS